MEKENIKHNGEQIFNIHNWSYYWSLAEFSSKEH